MLFYIVFGLIIEKNTKIDEGALKAISKSTGKRAILIALYEEDRVLLCSLSRQISVPYFEAFSAPLLAHIFRRLDFCVCESALAALYSLFFYTPCCLNVKSRENQRIFTSLFLRYGKRAIMPYLPSSFEKIKPEFNKSELEKILNIRELFRPLEARKAYPCRFPNQAQRQ